MTTAIQVRPFGHARRRLPLLAALALASAGAFAGTPINERIAADPAGQVEISNISGLVDVTAWARNEVEVTGELGKGAERLEISRTGNVVRVKVILPSKSSRAESSELFVKLPAGSSLAINTVSADIGVRGLRGSQRLQSVSGNLRTEAAAEDVECKTVSGDVNIAGSGQRALLTVTTVSGDAAVTKVAGEVNGNTVSGDFTVAMGEASRSRLRSTSGNLGLTGKLAADARLDIESISGDVRLDLAGPVGAEFDVSSFNGQIRNCFGPDPVRTSEYAPGRELRFREGSGAARVRIKTLNGDISVCNK
jgi:DUF4097 and DUF4098 domain-containing protein YvlB